MSTAPFQYIPSSAERGHVGPMLAQQIRANVVRLRNAKGWSRPELGRRLAPPTSGQQIERLEKGQRDIDAKWIERLARAFAVDPPSLLAGEEQFYDLTPQVADEVAEHLARLVLRGAEPDQAIVRDLSVVLQEMTATFSEHPQARSDPQVVRPVIDVLVRRRAQP